MNIFISAVLFIVQAEVEDTLKRIQGINGVIGTIVVNAEGNVNVNWTIYNVYNVTVVILIIK